MIQNITLIALILWTTALVSAQDLSFEQNFEQEVVSGVKILSTATVLVKFKIRVSLSEAHFNLTVMILCGNMLMPFAYLTLVK